jgi:drug/metabolite transporter (DMT)-like permease
MSAPKARPIARMAAMPPVLMATLGIFLLTGMDAVVKAQMQTHPVVVSIFLRFVMGGLVALVAMAWLAPPRPTGPEIRANLLRVPLVVLTAGSFFYSISQLPLAEAISLSFLAPAFIAVLGVVLLKEKLDRNILLALAVGFAGICLQHHPAAAAGREPASCHHRGVPELGPCGPAAAGRRVVLVIAKRT